MNKRFWTCLSSCLVTFFRPVQLYISIQVCTRESVPVTVLVTVLLPFTASKISLSIVALYLREEGEKGKREKGDKERRRRERGEEEKRKRGEGEKKRRRERGEEEKKELCT